MNEKLSTKLLLIIFIIGLSLLLYPSVSDYWNSFTQSRAIATYAEQVAELDNETYQKLLKEAKHYNKVLRKKANRFNPTDEEHEEYYKMLNVSGNGIIGYIEIDIIDCKLPIYHGTDDAILQIAVGHIEGTSLPVGGKGTHAVISGHRGLPSARLFTDLDQLVEGDTFVIRVLDEILTYEVDQILIVDPADVQSLEIVPGEDYLTLVTCTPYGVNTHRLLVRGHRIDNLKNYNNIRVTADALQIEPSIVASFIAIPILIILFIILLIKTRKKKEED